jgi:hypothetical protein
MGVSVRIGKAVLVGSSDGDSPVPGVTVPQLTTNMPNASSGMNRKTKLLGIISLTIRCLASILP